MNQKINRKEADRRFAQSVPSGLLYSLFLSDNPVSGINTDQCADKHYDGTVFMPFHSIHPIHLFSKIPFYKTTKDMFLPIRYILQ